MWMDWKDREGQGDGWDDDGWNDEDTWESDASWPGESLDADAWRGHGPADDDAWRGGVHVGEWPEWNAGPEYLMWKRLAEGDE